MKTIAVTNQKGGVGKTTTAVNLAHTLALKTEGKEKILLVDIDPQGNATTASGIQKRNISHGTLQVLEGNSIVSSAHQTNYGYDILPSNSELIRASNFIKENTSQLFSLKEALEKSDYDWVLFDCPPSLSHLTLTAFVASRSVLIPVQCEYYALEGVADLIATLTEIRQTLNPNLAIFGFLRTMFNPRTRLSSEVSEDLVTRFRGQVMNTIIPRNVKVSEAPSHGKPIALYDPKGPGGLNYLSLAIETIERASRFSAHFQKRGSL